MKEIKMNLLDKYISEIGKRLPRKNRRDIEAEIRSTLEDMLDERSRQAGKPADEAMLSALLKEYGSPQKVAATYAPPRSLIGPRLYPFFELVVKIVMAVVVAVSLVGFGVGFFGERAAGPEFLSALGKFAAGLLGGLITAFGNIVIVFAILERTLPASEFDIEGKDWDPSELEVEPDPDQVKIGEGVLGLIFMVAGLVIFNLYPDLIGLWFVVDGKWVSIPMLSQAFFTYLPWINLLIVLEIALNLYLLRRGAWTTFSRLGNILLEAAGLVLAAVMLSGPALVDLSASRLAGTPLADSAETMTRIFGLMPIIVLIILIVVQGLEVFQGLYKLATNRAQRPYAPSH
jgi:hypothetical protein